MRILDYASSRRMRTDLGGVLVRLALFLGVSVAAYYFIWWMVVYLVGRYLRIPI